MIGYIFFQFQLKNCLLMLKEIILIQQYTQTAIFFNNVHHSQISRPKDLKLDEGKDRILHFNIIQKNLSQGYRDRKHQGTFHKNTVKNLVYSVFFINVNVMLNLLK